MGTKDQQYNNTDALNKGNSPLYPIWRTVLLVMAKKKDSCQIYDNLAGVLRYRWNFVDYDSFVNGINGIVGDKFVRSIWIGCFGTMNLSPCLSPPCPFP